MVYPTDHSAEPSSQFTFKRISGVCTFCDRHVTRAQFCRGPDTGHRCQLGDYVLGGLGHCWARRPAWLGDSSIRLVTTREENRLFADMSTKNKDEHDFSLQAFERRAVYMQ